MKPTCTLPLVILWGILITACSSATTPAVDKIPPIKPIIAPPSSNLQTLPIDATVSIFSTQNNLTGNRVVGGSIDLSNANTINISLDGTPIWIVSAPFKGDVVFVAVMDNGNVQAFKISGNSYQSVDISPAQLPVGMPPTLVVSDDNIQLLTPPDDASQLTNPILVNGKLVYIASNGDVVMSDSESQMRLQINALPDARILLDENNRLLVLTQPTNRYAHGVVGDDLEASAVALIETSPELRVIQTISIKEQDVIEGISPIWADIDNDGVRDIIVTLSNSQTGARIVAYREDGTLLAESEPIGRGNRWRHQTAVAEFEPNKPPLLVDVRTPHIGGIVEFFQYKNGKLEIIQETQGFSTHSIGSRNLDSALAGDFNNDGVIELLAPDQPHTSLGIISLNSVISTLPLDGTLTSNLSATVIEGRLYVGAGTQINLRIWIP